MGPTLSPETSAFKLQTPGKFPEEYKLHSEHGESLKTTIKCTSFFFQVRNILWAARKYLQHLWATYKKNVNSLVTFTDLLVYTGVLLSP